MNIVVIYAHPDDAEVLAGGSMIKWAQAGHSLYAICCSNGDLGTRIPGKSAEEVARERKEELHDAMRIIGGREPIGLWFPDGFLREHRHVLKERLTYWVRKLKADRIITFDPWQRYEIHPDHMEVGLIASEVAVFSVFPLFYPEQVEEGLEPHGPQEIWYMVPTERPPNRIVDITDTFEQKVKSFLCHRSQIGMMADVLVPGADPLDMKPEDRERLEDGARGLLHMIASGIGSRYGIPLAEAFYAVKCTGGHFDDIEEKSREMMEKLTDEVEIV